METLIILFLLAYAEKDEAFKERLKKMLCFYRENRELFMALTEKQGTSQENCDNTPKSSPRESEESVRAFEEFLKKI